MRLHILQPKIIKGFQLGVITLGLKFNFPSGFVHFNNILHMKTKSKLSIFCKMNTPSKRVVTVKYNSSLKWYDTYSSCGYLRK
jgi:hypothetical protein